MCLCNVVFYAWSLVPAWSSWPISSVQLCTPAASPEQGSLDQCCCHSPALQHKDSSLLSSCTDCRALLLSLHRNIVFQECVRGGLAESFSLEMGGEASCGQAARKIGWCLQPGLCYIKMQLLWTPQASCCRVQCRLLRSVCATEIRASAAAPAGFYGSQLCCSSYSLAQTISVVETQTMPKFLFSQPVCSFPSSEITLWPSAAKSTVAAE